MKRMLSRRRGGVTIDIVAEANKSAVDRAFLGPGYAPNLDRKRLSLQIERIRAHIAERGLSDVNGNPVHAEMKYPPTIFPENSISAQLRNLRKLYKVDKRRRGRDRAARCAGIWEYRLVPPQESTAG
jgi:hypothetical protein